MKSILLGTLAAAALSASTFTLSSAAAQTDQQPSREERMQHWAAERETMLRARLAGMKAGLGLTADQERLWNPFESAVKDAFKSQMEATQKMIKMRESGQRMSPPTVWSSWRAAWLKALPNSRRSPWRPDHFTTASIRHRRATSDCLGAA